MFGKGLFETLYLPKIGWNVAALVSGRKDEWQAPGLKDARKIKRVSIAQVDIHDGKVDGVRSDEPMGLRQTMCRANNRRTDAGYDTANAIALKMVILRHEDVDAAK